MALVADSSSEIVMEAPPGARLMPEELVRLPPMETWRLERSFTQHSAVQGLRRACTLFNGHYLEVREEAGRRQRRAIFNLAFLDGQPVRYRVFAWRWLLAALLALALAVAAFWSARLAAGAGLLALAILLGCQVARRSRDQWIYLTLGGRVPAFVLDQALLGRQDLRAFTALLGERIEGARMLLPAGRERLPVIVAEHRRLAESEVISQRAYEKAKARLFRAGRQPR